MNAGDRNKEGEPAKPLNASAAGSCSHVRVAITCPDDHNPRFFGCVLLENRDDRRQLKLANDNRRHLIRNVINTAQGIHTVVAEVLFGPFKCETQRRLVDRDQSTSAPHPGTSFWHIVLWRGR
jgi:hypothetical protein